MALVFTKHESTCNFIKITGDKKELDRLKNTLTIKNTSIPYQIKMLVDSIQRNRSFGNLDKVLRLERKITELKEQEHVEYYQELSDSLVIPAGFWDLASSGDNCHLNTEVKPYLIPTLRPYQNESVNELLKYKRATCVLATGLGKTIVQMSVALSFIKAGKRVMIIVPTKDLVNQFIETAKKFHDSVTGAHSDMQPKLGTDILITTPMTATRHIDKCDCVLIDESHHSSADTYANLLGASDHIEYTYNFTATPFRSDGMDLAIHAFGGPIVYEKDLRYGIDNGYLNPFEVYIKKVKAMRSGEEIVIPKAKLATTAYKHLMSNPLVQAEIRSLITNALKKDRKIIVLFKTLAPAKQLAKSFKGIKVLVADANFKKPLKDFQNGTSNVLIATSKLIGEGIDIPFADVLIVCTQHSSDVMTYQSIGRILRLSDEKKKPIVIDVVATGYQSFARSIFARKKVYIKNAEKVVDL